MSDEIAVSVENLKKSYGKFQVLKGVNLQVKAGTIFGLLGSNGAGKSTMIKILVGSSRPSDGRVSVLGLDPFKDAHKLREQIGYMPQAPALYEDLAARTNVAFFGAAHHLPDLKQRVDEIMAFTNLTSRQNDAVFGFSGGMKQRVSLACALVHRPKVLFLDEPTAGVDPKLREAFWQHFRELASQGSTLFISTHLMDEALLCDKLAIMRDGEVLVSDTPKNIMRRGETRIHIWRNEQEEVFRITDYPSQLPVILQKYQLDPAITKIELEEDTLEAIMLRIIDNRATSEPTTTEKHQHGVLKVG